MYFVFLWEVLKRAFTPAPRVTDMLQILAASTLPAVTKFAGIPLSQSAGNEVLAYIGLVALSFVTIRLFWAPYAMWKEQGSDILGLQTELSRPQRLVVEHLAKHRAKARSKLSVELLKFYTLSVLGKLETGSKTENWFFSESANGMERIRHLQAEAGLCESFETARLRLVSAVLSSVDSGNDDSVVAEQEAKRIVKIMQAYLMGDLTDEGLALRLPQGTALEKRQ